MAADSSPVERLNSVVSGSPKMWCWAQLVAKQLPKCPSWALRTMSSKGLKHRSLLDLKECVGVGHVPNVPNDLVWWQKCSPGSACNTQKEIFVLMQISQSEKVEYGVSPVIVCLMLSSHFFATAYRIIRTKVQQPPNQQVPASSHSIGKKSFFFFIY